MFVLQIFVSSYFFRKIIKNMSIHLQPPIPLVTLVKTEPPTVIKNEPPKEALEEEISTDIKDIDIVYHPLSEGLIKSETVLEDILENKHLESVQTQAIVKAENSQLIKTENITQRNKTEDTSDENVTKDTGQAVVEVQDLNGVNTRTRKARHPEKTNLVKCYKTIETTIWEKDKKNMKVIKVPVIPVEVHEYTSLAKDKHVCNHCKYACNRFDNLKLHIKQMHREATTTYLCPYCTYKSKWRSTLTLHFISKHKDTKDIQWFQCDLCEMKFKLKYQLTRHMKVHLRHKQMKDGLDLHEKGHQCDKGDYETCRLDSLKIHNLVHLKPEEIEYLYCYHCSYKCQRKDHLKSHIFRHHFKNVKQGKRHHCDKCDYKTYSSTTLKIHNLVHLKPEEIQYFYCYHCSYKSKYKGDLKQHIFRHFKKEQVEFDCYICNFLTQKRESIIKHIKKHSKVQNKSEINEGS